MSQTWPASPSDAKDVAPSARASSHIVLVGMMGSGKSTIGRLLAERLGWRYLDNDDAVVALTARDAADVIRTSGEASLHAAEATALLDALDSGEPTVIAAAAGVVMDAGCASALAAAHQVVYLRARPQTLRRRIGSGAGRRSDATDLDWLEARFQERDRIYRDVATAVVDVDERTPEEIVEAILARQSPGAWDAGFGSSRRPRRGPVDRVRYATSMSVYAEFSHEEQGLLRASLEAAAVAVSAASPGRPEEAASEGFAAASYILERKADYVEDRLVSAVIADLEARLKAEQAFPDFVKVASAPGARDWAIDTIRAVAALLDAKATPEDATAYKAWLMRLATAVALAGREDQGFLGRGGVKVNDAEQSALQDIAEALGTHLEGPLLT